MLLYSRCLYNGCRLTSSYLITLNHNIAKQSNAPSVRIFCAKHLSTTSNFCEYDRGTRGNKTLEEHLPPEFFKNITNPRALKKGFKTFLKEVGKWRQEKREDFFLNSPSFRIENTEGVVDMLFTFDNEEELKQFIVSTDSSNNEGYSSASLKLTRHGTALFSGYISTVIPKGMNLDITGYANIMSKRKMKSFRRPSYYRWQCYTHLVLKIRGDGHTYGIILPTPGEYDVTWNNQYIYPMYTRGGPYWQIVKIPFSFFVFTQKGYNADNQNYPPPLNNVARFGITIGNVYEGPFKLEIDYVGLEYKEIDKGVCPYEEYSAPPGIWTAA